MKIYLLTSLLIAVFSGCVSSSPNLQKNNTSLNSLVLYGEKIPFNDTLKKRYTKTIIADYDFQPKDNYVRVEKYKMGTYVQYHNKYNPSYFIALEKPMIITSIKYIPNYLIANSAVEAVLYAPSAIVNTPFIFLGSLLNSHTPIKPSVAKLSTYYHNGKRYRGHSYNFSIKENNNIFVKNPFGNKNVKKILLSIDQSWMPASIKINRDMKWSPGKVIVDAIDISNHFGIIDYTLKNRKDKEENEDLIDAIVSKNSKLFKKLRRNRSKYHLPDVSFFNLPSDVDINYARNNKYSIFEEGIYKNNKGKYITLESTDELFVQNKNFKIDISPLSVDNKNVKFNKQEVNKKAKYIDFSKDK